MGQIDVGATLHILTMIEMHARNARELLAAGVLTMNTPDGLLMPGQEPRQYTNAQIGRAQIGKHSDAMRQLRDVCESVFQPEQSAPTEPHPNRMKLHLNGDGAD